MNKSLLTLLLAAPLTIACRASEDRFQVTPETTPSLGARAHVDEEEIPLDEVPDAVLQAALDAVPGFVAEEAAFEIEDGEALYELEGEVDGEEIEIEITEDGTVVEIESDDDDDDDEDDDD